MIRNRIVTFVVVVFVAVLGFADGALAGGPPHGGPSGSTDNSVHQGVNQDLDQVNLGLVDSSGDGGDGTGGPAQGGSSRSSSRGANGGNGGNVDVRGQGGDASSDITNTVVTGPMESTGTGATYNVSGDGNVFTAGGTFNNAPTVVTQVIDNSVNIAGDNTSVGGSTGGNGGRNVSRSRGGRAHGGTGLGGDNNASGNITQVNGGLQNGTNVNFDK